MRRKRRVADGRSIPNRAAVFLTRSCCGARWRYFRASRGRHRAGRRARLASRVGDAPRAYLRRARDDASRVAERGARRRAPRVDPRGGVLQLVAIRRVRQRRHERRGSRRRVPVRGRGAERRVPRLVRPGTSHPPLPPHHLPRVPLPTPRERHRDIRAVTFRAPSPLYSFPVERRRGGATTRRARDRPRPFVPVPSSPSLPTRPSPREHAPPSPPNVSSSRRRLDTTSPRRRLPRPKSLRPTTRSSFSSSPSRASSPRASRPSPSCIDGGGARRLPSRRNAPRAPPRPTRGTCARLAPTAPRGAASRKDSAGASFEGSCTVCTC